MKIKRNMSTPESIKFWKHMEKASSKAEILGESSIHVNELVERLNYLKEKIKGEPSSESQKDTKTSTPHISLESAINNVPNEIKEKVKEGEEILGEIENILF